MKSTFSFTSSASGKQFRIDAEYTSTLIDTTVCSDGYTMPGEKRILESGRATAYVDGKEYSHCGDGMWYLSDYIDPKTHNKMKMIPGLRVVITDSETAKRYSQWLEQLIYDGSPDDVREFRRNEKIDRLTATIKHFKSIIVKGDSQPELPSQVDADGTIKAYNSFMNEGGYGYIPEIISRDAYDAAKAQIKFIEEELSKLNA